MLDAQTNSHYWMTHFLLFTNPISGWSLGFRPLFCFGWLMMVACTGCEASSMSAFDNGCKIGANTKQVPSACLCSQIVYWWGKSNVWLIRRHESQHDHNRIPPYMCASIISYTAHHQFANVLPRIVYAMNEGQPMLASMKNELQFRIWLGSTRESMFLVGKS